MPGFVTLPLAEVRRIGLPSPALLAKTRRGILFSGPLVVAIRADQKRVTRRLDKSWLKLKAGDLLYVQETIARDKDEHIVARYVADNVMVGALDAWRWQRNGLPSIHLPRELARIVLRVTEAPRLEPVKCITEEDARLEGVLPIHAENDLALAGDDRPYRRGFVAVWCDLHTKPGERWDDNPEVVRIPFDRVEGE